MQQVLWNKAKENMDLRAHIQALQQAEAEAAATAQQDALQNWDKLVCPCLSCNSIVHSIFPIMKRGLLVIFQWITFLAVLISSVACRALFGR